VEFEERLIVFWIRSTSEDEVLVIVELESYSELVVVTPLVWFEEYGRERERERDREMCGKEHEVGRVFQ
jgi:hypothetical protein